MIDCAAPFAHATVVREGSFEQTARALHVTPTAVSQRRRLLQKAGGLRAGGARGCVSGPRRFQAVSTTPSQLTTPASP